MKKGLLFSLILLMFFACTNRQEKKKSEQAGSLEEVYLEKGRAIVGLAQPELLKNVSKAMGEGGPVHAIDFCHLRALDIKDSLSQANHAEIRRIALKFRNPEDRPRTSLDIEVLNDFQHAVEQGLDTPARVYVFDDRIEYYQAIPLGSGACLVCHGEPGAEVNEETYAAILERYPNDLATGFALNDFRGSWKITFER